MSESNAFVLFLPYYRTFSKKDIIINFRKKGCKTVVKNNYFPCMKYS